MRNAPDITIEQVCDLFQCSLVSANRLSNGMFFTVEEDGMIGRRFKIVHQGMRLWIHVWSGEACASYLQGEDVWDSSFDEEKDYFVVDFSYKEACIWKTFEIGSDTRRDFIESVSVYLAEYNRVFQNTTNEFVKQLTSVTNKRKEHIRRIVEFATALGYNYNEKSLRLDHDDSDWPIIRLDGKNSVVVKVGYSSYHYNFDELHSIRRCVLHRLESKVIDKQTATNAMTDAIKILSQSIETDGERCKA